MIDFDCLQFQRWLTEGGAAGPAGDAGGSAPCAADDAAAHLHAATCAACGDRLAAEHAVDRVLRGSNSTVVPRPAAGFADRVMARVTLAPQEHPRATRARVVAIPSTAAIPSGLPEALPWWVRAAAQPATALAFVLAGVALAFAPQLSRLGASAPAWSAGALAALAGALAPAAGWVAPLAGLAGGNPWVATMLGLAALPPIALLSRAAYGFGLRLAAPPAARAARA